MISAQWLIGLILAFVISGLAYKVRSLNTSGAIAAVFIGFFTFGGGGLTGALVLLTFFISASALSRVGGERKRRISRAFAKGGRRDAGQVLANGSLVAAFACLYGIYGDPHWLAGMLGAMAAANADTWATELGVLAKNSPRLITTGRPVVPGTSGGVTWEGILASVAGAGLIGLIGVIFRADGVFLLAAVLGGLGGSLVDSLLGATVQAIYYCPTCAKETESSDRHHCGQQTTFRRGLSWINNDLVNFSATFAGVLIAVSVVHLAL